MRSRWLPVVESHGLPAWIIPDYWFLLTLAIITGSLLTVVFWSRQRDSRMASDLLFWGIPALLLGAKIFYFLQYGFPGSLDLWNTGGMSLYGGLIGLLVAWGIYYRVHPFPAMAFLDCVAPALGFGLFVGRLGCFMAGCNGGLPSDLPWALRFPRGTSVFFHQAQAGWISPQQDLSLPVHPTQLYEALFGLIAGFLLWKLLSIKNGEGQVFFTGIFWYAVYRFLTELLRNDSFGLHPLGFLTFAQLVSMILITGSLAALTVRRVPQGQTN
ncbi:MAG: prolipoprotein diacylglyceryl transferase [Acidobacteria bacterium]|nr:prolipoprotein diacylglyceryl transferase [Acidobacteriota bacterium]